MVEILFGKITDTFGKAFLLAGLVPAVVILLGWHAYDGGVDAIRQLIALTEKTAEIIWITAQWIGLGFVFFAGRSVLLHLFKNVPSRLILPLNRFLTSRQLQLRWKAEQEKEELASIYTSVRWPLDGFSKSPSQLQWIASSPPSDTENSSKQARTLVGKIARESSTKPILLKRREYEKIIKGLSQWYALGAKSNDCSEFKKELEEWKKLAADVLQKQVLEATARKVHQRWVKALRRFNSFPSEEWIQPTKLGNQLAALDDYAEHRYQIDTSTLWARLWVILSKEDRKDVVEAKLSVEVLINLCTAFTLLSGTVLIASIAATYSALMAGPVAINWRAVLFVIIPLALAVGAYHGATFAVTSLREKITSLVDLHRLRLLRALGFNPTSIREELELFKELRGFFTQAIPRKARRLNKSDV